jgi:hypothetical protein
LKRAYSSQAACKGDNGEEEDDGAAVLLSVVAIMVVAQVAVAGAEVREVTLLALMQAAVI